MSDESTYKQIVRYMDNFHQDIGRLLALIERLMEEQGYLAYASAGNRTTWSLSSHIAMPDRWRIPNLTRLFAPEGEERFEETLAYAISLEANSAFPFPAMLCARITHPPLFEKEAYTRVWNSDLFLSLARDCAQWEILGAQDGWTVARPVNTAKSAIANLQGYFLNLFELVDRQHVVDNVILPLTTPEVALDELTVPHYAFGTSEER